MDYNKIKQIKLYSDQIRKFRNLDQYKSMSDDDFKVEMMKIFPDFVENNLPIFDCITQNKDMQFLDLMFHKLEEINTEFESRKNEISKIEEDINDIKSLLHINKDMSKEEIISFLNSKSSKLYKNYPIIIERLHEKETRNLSTEQLLFDQIKFKHEKQIGEILANKYVKPKLKNNYSSDIESSSSDIELLLNTSCQISSSDIISLLSFKYNTVLFENICFKYTI